MVTVTGMKEGVVLLVDDQPLQIDVTRSALGPRFTVKVATSGELALHIAARGGVDLILLDVLMPGLSGYEVCRQLKNTADTRDIPIIFLTSKDETADEAEGLALGAVDYIRKPPHPHLLQARVSNHLELKRHRDHLEMLVQARTRELEQARSQLAAANQAKADFLAVISHEMRTPLNSVIGFSEFLLSHAKLVAEDRQLVRIIHEAGTHLLGNINDIIDFIQLDPQNFTLLCKPFDLAPFVRDTLGDFQKEAERKGLFLEWNMDQPFPQPVYGDARRLGQVLGHLLGNGIKFTSRGGITLTVTVTPDQDRVQIRFTIQDTGCGIPPDKQQMIFQQFTQAASPITRRHGGLGLGLAICKKLVAMMAGELVLMGSDASGTTFAFTVMLPTNRRPA